MPDSDDAGPFGRYAKEYRKQGWVAPLPLPPNAKEAPPAGYHGNNKRIPVLNEIRKWLRDNGTGNICLALSTVERVADVPFTYDGKQVTEWEHIAIDIDDYGEKHGWAEYCALVGNGLPELPATIASSARWAANEHSNLRVFLVPTGHVYHGKVPGCKHIDVIASNLRYMVAAPSLHPTGSAYTWRVGGPNGWVDVDGVPAANEARVLPEPWFNHIVKRGETQGSSEDSGLEFDELWDWAGKTFHEPDTMCEFMEREVTKYISELDASNLHEPLTRVLSRLTKNCLEGHSGYRKAILDYINTWSDAAGERGDRDPDTMRGEIQRSVSGALNDAKIAWDERNQYVPADTCTRVKGRADNWGANEITDADYGGLGPIIGKIQLGFAKPANEYHMNDVGNAQHFVDLFGENMKFIDDLKMWILWDGERWHRDYDGRLAEKAFDQVAKRQLQYSNELRKRGANDDKILKQADAWRNWSVKSGERPRIKNALDLAKSRWYGSEPVTLRGNVLDTRQDLLGVANGVLELGTEATLRPARKEDYVTFNTNIPYIPWRQLGTQDPDDAANEHSDAWQYWYEYCNQFLSDEDVREMLQRTLGHMLFGSNLEKKLTFFWGETNTGKSTLIAAVQGALGDYCKDVNINIFREKETAPEMIDALPKRIVTLIEADQSMLDVNVIKRMTGGLDKMSGRLLYSNTIVRGRPHFNVIIACNKPPNMLGADAASDDRVLTIPFKKQIEEAKVDYSRAAKAEDVCGVVVLSWVVEGWNMFKAIGLKRPTWPEAVVRANKKLLSELNDHRRFIDEFVERARDCEDGRRAIERAKKKAKLKSQPAEAWPRFIDQGWLIPAGNVYQRYVRWCQAENYEAVKKHVLLEDLGIGPTVVRHTQMAGKSERYYVGVRWKDWNEPKTNWRQK